MSETYTEGGDSGYQPVSPKLIGQTFTPVVEHQLEYIDLNISIWGVGGDLVITVHDLETDPDMTGFGISRAVQTDFEPGFLFTRQRIRTPMPKVTLHKDHPYGFCVTNHPDPWWNKIFVRYDLAEATYPRGQRFTKDNRADPPTYYPDSDLIFTEFGRPVAPPTPPNPDPDPPPTPPHPPIDKWLIIQTAQKRTLTGEIIIAYTNVPCHLWMRWSLVPPRIHKIPIIRRGLVVMTHYYYCFDVYHDNEQEEPGDTLIHTFVKEPWPFCQHRWWYFHGGVDASPSPSTGPIFDKHPLEPLFFEKEHCTEIAEGTWFIHKNNWFGTAFEAPKDQTIHAVLAKMYRSADPGGSYTHNTAYLQEAPDWKPTGKILSSWDFYTGDLPLLGVPVWTYLSLSSENILADHRYIIWCKTGEDVPYARCAAWQFCIGTYANVPMRRVSSNDQGETWSATETGDYSTIDIKGYYP